MMLYLGRAALLALMLLLFSTCVTAGAQDPATSFADLRISPNTQVCVRDRSGHEVNGRVTALSARSLSLLVDGTPHVIMEADVLRIVRKGDSLRNGALWGLVAGGALGVAAVATCEPYCHGGSAGGALAFLALAGSGVGMLIDSVIPGHRNVYEARPSDARGLFLTPVVFRSAAGVFVGIHF